MNVINVIQNMLKLLFLSIMINLGLSGCGSSGGSSTSGNPPAESQSLYFSNSVGVVYKNNTVLAGAAAIAPDGEGIKFMVFQDGLLYVATGSGSVYIESGGLWSQIGNTAIMPDGEITSIAVLNGVVYAGGIDYSNNSAVVYVESSNGWSLVSGAPVFESGAINSIAVEGNNIYAGGAKNLGNIVGVVYVESGHGWQLIGNSPVVTSGVVSAIAVEGNKIYAAANTTDESFSPMLVYLNSGSGWTIVGESAILPKGRINSLAINGNNVYVGGADFSNPGQSNGVVYLDSGDGWSLVGGESVFESGEIYSIAVSNNNIYAAGKVGTTNNESGAVYVESGHGWNLLGNTIPLASISSLAVSSSNIYIGSNRGLVYHLDDSSWASLVNGALCDFNDFITLRYLSNYSSLKLTLSEINLDDFIGVGLIHNGNGLYSSCGNSVFLNTDTGWSQSVVDESSLLLNITNSNDTIYVTAVSPSLDSIAYKQLGTGWSQVGAPLSDQFMNVIKVSESKIYLGGSDVDGNALVYVESSNSWSLIGGVSPFIGVISSLVIKDGVVYAGATDTSDSENTRGLVYFESNSNWNILGGTAVIESGEIRTIIMDEGKIYAGGANLDNNTGVVYVESINSWSMIGGGAIPAQYGSAVISLFADSNHNIYATTNMNSIMMSANGGAGVWTKLPYSSYSTSLSIKSMVIVESK